MMSPEARCAEDVVRQAGQMIRAAFGRVTYSFKARQDYLTETDSAVERAVRAALLARFPDHAVLGEEEGGREDIASAQHLWIVDPVDGTANFARAIPHCCISLAYLYEGQVQVGAIYDPLHDELFLAELGQGARCNERPIAVSDIASCDEASVEIGWSWQAPQHYMDSMRAVIDAGCVIRRAGSGALGMAYVAAGRCEAYINAHTNSWDCAAGLLLVSEAGGRVNDFWTPGAITQGNAALTCNALLADEMARCSGIPLLPLA